MNRRRLEVMVLMMFVFTLTNRAQALCELILPPKDAICAGQQASYQASTSPSHQGCYYHWTGATPTEPGGSTATNTWWECGNKEVTVRVTGCTNCAYPQPKKVTVTTRVVKVDIVESNVVDCIEAGSKTFHLASADCCDVYWSLSPSNYPGGPYLSGGGCSVTVHYGTNCGTHTLGATTAVTNLACGTPENPNLCCDTATLNVVKITSQTACTGPNDPARTTIGVAEQVTLAVCGLPPGDFWWSTTGGSVSPTNENPTLFTAPSNAANPTIAIHFPGGSCDKAFTVLEPTGFSSANVIATNHYPTNAAAAGMRQRVIIGPQSVSFNRVEILEIDGPATNVAGWFTNFTATDRYHHPSGWLFLNCGNHWDDLAQMQAPSSPPWTSGSMQWDIPAAWRVVGTTNTNSMAGWTQYFTINSNGTCSVQKFGHTVTRTTNNVITVTP